MSRLKANVFSDTGFINVKSLRQNMCYQGYSLQNFVYICSIRDQKEAGRSLMEFFNNIGALAEIVSDHTSLLLEKNLEFTKTAYFIHIKQSSCEPHTQKQNDFEGDIWLLKWQWKIKMASNNIPKWLWDYSLVYKSRILSIIAWRSDGMPGLEDITGNTIDITEWLDFPFFWCLPFCRFVFWYFFIKENSQSNQ